LERRFVEDERMTLAEWEELYRRRRMSERPGRDTDSVLQSLGNIGHRDRCLCTSDTVTDVQRLVGAPTTLYSMLSATCNCSKHVLQVGDQRSARQLVTVTLRG
jgi:hypothetical protein